MVFKPFVSVNVREYERIDEHRRFSLYPDFNSAIKIPLFRDQKRKAGNAFVFEVVNNDVVRIHSTYSSPVTQNTVVLMTNFFR